MKKSRTEERPQPAQIEAIERCIERGKLAEADERLKRLQAAFPNFKPLRRLAYEIARESSDTLRRVFSAWEWCTASPNSSSAFTALAESSGVHFPYLFLHALEQLIAHGEDPGVDLATVRAALSSDLSEDEGRRIDLCQVLLGSGKAAEAGALVEHIAQVSAQNNFGQALFAQGKILRAEAVFAAVVESAPENLFALGRLLTLRLWLAGRDAALPVADHLLALKPNKIDAAGQQLDGAILLGRLNQAEAVYLATLKAPWYAENCKRDAQAEACLHMSGALVAWRQERHEEAVSRLDKISDVSEDIADLRTQCTFFRMTANTPEWMIGQLTQWWPIAHILSLHPEKLVNDGELFARWQAPMPHPDYLVAIALNGGKAARSLAIAALQFQAQTPEFDQSAALLAMIELLNLPCGPDAVRSALHRWLNEKGLLEKDTPVLMLVGSKSTEVRPLEITIHAEAMEEETVLIAADHRIYGEAMDLINRGQRAKAQQLMEKLLPRYPDYPRVLTAVAVLREAGGEPIEHWAPLIRHAAEIDPDYFFARTALVKLLAAEGKVDEARALLAPLLELKEMHSSEWRSLILAQIHLANANVDLPAITRLNAMLQDCIERFG
jgi:tetratricopeptide (TPR) repeat protein